MNAFGREVLYRVLIIGAVLFGAGVVGFQWLPLLAAYVFMGAANEHLALWTKQRRRNIFFSTEEMDAYLAQIPVPHIGADMAWAEELEGMLDRPLAIEASAVKVRTSELERVMREWSGAT